MQSHQFTALKRSASVLCGQRSALALSFASHLDGLIPGLGKRLQGAPAEELISCWVESARCAQRWQNVSALLTRAAADLSDLGIRSREFETLQHAWMATLQDALGERLDDDLREGWRALLASFVVELRATNEGHIGSCATFA